MDNYIHYIWIDFKNEMNPNPDIPEMFKDRINICKNLNPDFQIKIWNGSDCYNFMKDNYSKYLVLYESLPEMIMKCDMARYFILYHYGGFYLDCDRICLKPFTGLIKKYKNYDVFLGKFNKNIVDLLKYCKLNVLNNDFLYSKKNSDFMLWCMENIKPKNMGNRTLNILNTAGPVFLSKMYATYNGPEKIMVLSKEVNACDQCSCSADFSDSYTFADISNSSWHTPFDKFINFVYCNSQYFLFVVVVLLFINMLKRKPN